MTPHPDSALRTPHSALRTPHSALRTQWNPWPVSIIAFFSVAILGFASFIVFCNIHSTDLVAADYYEQELRYQDQMDRLQHAQQLNHLAAVKYDAGQRVITISLPPGHAHASGAIQLYRPSAAVLDRELKLDLKADGSQTIDARNLRPGLWKVRALWKLGGQEYFIDQKVVIGAEAGIDRGRKDVRNQTLAQRWFVSESSVLRQLSPSRLCFFASLR